VAILGEALIVLEFGDVGQAVIQDRVRTAEEGPADLAYDGAAAPAAQGGEVIGMAGRIVETLAVFLEERPSALRTLQHPLHAHKNKIIVGQFRAGSGVRAARG
jgi:hypothetical protein